MDAEIPTDAFVADTLRDVPDLVPARMVNEYVYCPRLAYIEWVQSDFLHSHDTLDGQLRHRSVNAEAGSLPTDVGEDAAIHARSVWLSAPTEHLTARIDLLEGEGRTATPVDYKRGSPPRGGEVWEADEVQLCAQGLVLSANGYQCESGIVYYCSTRQRVQVQFGEATVARTRRAVAEICEMAASGVMPPPLVDSPKCGGCSLAPVCLPDELSFLAHHLEADDDGIRRLVPARDDALPLYVQHQGARLRKKGEVFEVWADGVKQAEARMFEVSHIALFGNVQVTTQALAAAIDRGLPVLFFTSGGWFRGVAHGMPHRNAELRLRQFRWALDGRASLRLARCFTAGKIANCRTILRRNAAGAPVAALDELRQLTAQARRARSAEELLGIEGRAGRVYYEVFPRALKGHTKPEWRFDFRGRNRRPPTDRVNALLSYAYSLLAKELTVAALAVGLDPYVGFYHRPRYGRPALALDLMEEFRPIVADSVTITLVNNGILKDADFVARGRSVSLTEEGRRKFLAAFEQRLDTLVTHPVFGYRISYRRVFEVQARLLARCLTGELRSYPVFKTR